MSAPPPLWWAALGAGLVYVGVVARDLPGWIRGVKVVPAALLALVLAPAYPLAAAGMVFSALGDGFLLDKKRFFLPGLGAFLLGHLLFIPAFLLRSGAVPAPNVCVGLALAAFGLLRVVWPRKPALRVAVPIYAFVLCGMVAAATTLGTLGTLGGLLFLASDGMLSIRLFRSEFPGSYVLVMLTYYAALLTLTLALG